MSKWLRAPALAAPMLLAASVAFPAEGAGGLLGWVEDTRGAPVAGAVISLFGKGVGAAGLVTLSDSTGRFFLPSLPPGSYTVRALRTGHVAAAARKITVLPDRELRFTLSLTPEAEAAAAAAAAAARRAEDAANAPDTAENRRELIWLLRHKRRSVLEEQGAAPRSQGADAPRAASLASWLPDLGATLELVTNPENFGLGDPVLEGDGISSSLSALRLQGRISDSGAWSLGGLVSESGSTSWRMSAEFYMDAGEHEIRAGSGYGTRMLRPTQTLANRDERVGAIFVQDRWQVSDDVSATVGGRFSHLGFLDRVNYVDPSLTLALQRAPGAVVRASVSRRTLAPGGDLLTLSTLATAPSIAMASMDPRLRAERSLRVEVVIEETLGPASVRAHTFYEAVQDQLGNAFNEPGSARALRIFNAGHLATRGLGITVARRFGNALSGSMTYTYGHGWRPSQARTLPEAVADPRMLAFDEGDFHDLVARLKTVIAGSDTRVEAFYRVNSLLPQGEERGITSMRFDVQLSQGLPFLGDLTHADWDLLLAVRNLYYDEDEGAMLDEVAVLNPPKRVLGGIAVRF